MATPKRYRYDGPIEYVRLNDASKIFGVGQDKIEEVAKECGAYRKLDKCVLVNLSVMRSYIEAHTAY